MDDTSINTGAEQGKPPKGKPFVKGDPRINRKGRPKNFDKLRAFSLEVLAEPATDGKGQPVIIAGHVATRLEVLLREWLTDEKHQKDLIEIAFGKVPTQLDVNLDKIVVTLKGGQDEQPTG